MRIKKVGNGYAVASLVAQLADHPELWNEHNQRLSGPHAAVSDIWVRYNAWENYLRDPATFHDAHVSSWYPCIAKIPAARALVEEVFQRVGGTHLGGVLITRIPPGEQVKPHQDHGWHADVHEKFAVQIKGNQQQAFCFEGVELRPEPGDLYTFDNHYTHWVINDSDEERITLIICLRRNQQC